MKPAAKDPHELTPAAFFEAEVFDRYVGHNQFLVDPRGPVFQMIVTR